MSLNEGIYTRINDRKHRLQSSLRHRGLVFSWETFLLHDGDRSVLLPSDFHHRFVRYAFHRRGSLRDIVSDLTYYVWERRHLGAASSKSNSGSANRSIP